MFAAILLLAIYLAWPNSRVMTNKAGQSPTAEPPPAVTTEVFNKLLYSTDEASSLWAVVNKGRSLPSNYVPAGLVTPSVPLRFGAGASEMSVRPEMAAALQAMFAGAKTYGHSFMLTSGYRSYGAQISVYNSYVSQSGAAVADTFSARPGHSEHQTGLAADIEPLSRVCELDICFGDMPEGKWLAANASKYGLIIRYQRDNQNLTGYQYEPWHVRYVGADLAAQLQPNNQTLEQFFGLPAAVNYEGQSFRLKQ